MVKIEQSHKRIPLLKTLRKSGRSHTNIPAEQVQQ